MTKSRLVLAALAASLMVAAGPASALTWTCTAKNLRGQAFTRSAVGVYSEIVHSRAKAKALAACGSASAACAITSCTRP